MDRGVKIAIFVASVLSLGLGLIWDQVLTSARNVIDERPDVMGPERVEARVGSPDIPRAVPRAAQPQTAATKPAPDPKPATPEAAAPTPAPPVTADTEYTLASGDNPWQLAHVRFKDRKLETDDIRNANPTAKWRPGEKIKIPAKK